MSGPVLTWWVFLCVAATVNVAAWCLTALHFSHRRAAMSVDAAAATRMQLILSCTYVLGCAFRSVLPVFDIPRLGLFDTWLSSVMVGRSVATVAELSFAAQWALLFHQTARSTGSVTAKVASQLILPLIATAETCSWYAVLTTYNLAHVFENSLWGLSAALGLAAIITLVPRLPVERRRMPIAWCSAGSLYVAYMFAVDVPGYWARWTLDQARGKHYLSVAQGLADVAHHRVVSWQWTDWKSEVIWMSAYFTIAVWISISLIGTRVATTLTLADKASDFGPSSRSRAARPTN